MEDRSLKILEYSKIIERLAGLTQSPLGREYALKLKPSDDKELIIKGLTETREAESILSIDGKTPIGPFSDVRQFVKKARVGSVLGIGEILAVGRLLRMAKQVKEQILPHEEKGEIEIITSMARGIQFHQRLYEDIFRCIESEDHIADQASTELYGIRRKITSLHEKVRERLNSLVHSVKYQKYLQEPIVTIRNDRYVVPVKQEYRQNIPGLIHDQSSSGATLFVEPMAVVETNNELKQWIIKEEQEIERILLRLTKKIEEVAEDILDTLDIMIKLDFIFAKGRLSLDMNCVCPRLIDDSRLRIVNGRHPLISPSEVVPISLTLGEDYHTLVITGPNTGGKTVTLKTVGLFVLMNQSGLHIPADFGTEMGIFNGVFADIGDEQSIEQSLSTFSSHMTNIVNIIKQVKPGHLVLFDELGAGTDPVEGAALAMSILDTLHRRGITTMATTHYSELKIFALTRDRVQNASVEFDVETLRPTYRLLVGIPGKSNAFEISMRLGLERDIIDGARELISQEDAKFEDIISSMEESRVKIEKEREMINEHLRKIEKLKSDLESKNRKINAQKEKLLKEAREDARKILRQARDEAEEIINDIKRLSIEVEEKERNRTIEHSRKKLREGIGKLEREMSDYKTSSRGLVKPPKNLKMGESVYLVNLDQKGQVLSGPDQNGEVQVQVGIMKVNVHISNIRRVEEKTETYNNVMSGKKKVSLRNTTVSRELDLRGQNAEEGIILADKYLDDAFISGLKEVTIIHGKGTGILRNSIHQYLNNHPHVASYRLGKYGEGESGVTVVELK